MVVQNKTLFGMHSGKLVDIANFDANMVHLDDIAHHLAKICRYGGCLSLFEHYSVAHHSVKLALYAIQEYDDVELSRYLLLHDASEAYLGDVVNGVKALLPDYKNLENKISTIINEKYDIKCSNTIAAKAKELDTRILLDEARRFVPQHYDTFVEQVKPLTPLNIYLSPDMPPCNEWKLSFLNMCHTFGIRDNEGI